MTKSRKFIYFISAFLILGLAVIFGLRFFFGWVNTRFPRFHIDDYSVVEVNKAFFNADETAFIYKDVDLSTDNFSGFTTDLINDISGKPSDGLGPMIGSLPMVEKIYLADDNNNKILIKIYKSFTSDSGFLTVSKISSAGKYSSEYILKDADKYFKELSTLDVTKIQ